MVVVKRDVHNRRKRKYDDGKSIIMRRKRRNDENVEILPSQRYNHFIAKSFRVQANIKGKKERKKN